MYNSNNNSNNNFNKKFINNFNNNFNNEITILEVCRNGDAIGLGGNIIIYCL